MGGDASQVSITPEGRGRITIGCSLAELAASVFVAVALAATDASALSRLFVCVLAKRLGVELAEIMNYADATAGETTL